MSNIITAGNATNNGTSISSDTSGVLELKTGSTPTTALTIGTNQVVTFAQQPAGTFAGTGPAFSAYQSSAQSLSAATTTLITFQTEEWDTGSCYNNTGSTVTLNGLSVPAWSFCPNVAGYYIVDFAFTRATNSTDMTMFIFKNASAYKQGATVYTNSGSMTMSCIVLLNGTGDYIQAYGYLGSAQNVSALSAHTYFQAAMIRSA